jgi:hypothetical protein
VRPGLAAFVALFLLVAAAPAAASSIVLVRDGDLYLSTPDGGFERRLTVTGGYSSPSMDDNGTIVALKDGSFIRLRGDGGMIGAPVRAIGGDWVVASGPFDARVSPDGVRIAYWFSGRRRLCLPTDASCSLQDSDVTAYAYAGRVTDPLELGAVRGYREPSWIASARAVLFHHGAKPSTGEAVAVNRVGGGESGTQGWFSYDDGTQLAQGQLSRAGDKLAAVAGQSEIHLFGVAAPPPALPELRCIVPGTGLATPTWSPDGTMLAWAASDGVHVAGPIPDLRAPVPDCGVIRERRLAAGSEPFWGPAPVPGAPATGPSTAASRPVARRPARAFRSLHVARRQHGPGVRLRVRILRGPARVDARLTQGGRRAGRRLVRRARAGTLHLRISLDRSARHALARRGRLALRLRLAVRAPGRASPVAHRRVLVKAS